MSDSSVRYEVRTDLALLHIDDGKANALSHGVLAALDAGLDRAVKEEVRGVVVAGRPGRFSAGFDLGIMREGAEAAAGLVAAGARLFLRFAEHPQPIVIACTGHAIAAGAIALLAADARLGAAGTFQIGLNETRIGMTLPRFAIELARMRLSKRHFLRATAQAELYAPEAAADAGYLDRVVEPETLLDAALEEAARLGALHQPAFAQSKQRANGALVDELRAGVDADLAGMLGLARG